MSVISRESTGVRAQVKTDEIIADLDDMQREREIAGLQNKQGKVHYMRTSRSTIMHKVIDSHNKDKDVDNHFTINA